MTIIHFTATYTDPDGVHHEKGVTVTAATRSAGWRKAVAVAVGSAAGVPAGWNLIFMRWEPIIPA